MTPATTTIYGIAISFEVAIIEPPDTWRLTIQYESPETNAPIFAFRRVGANVETITRNLADVMMATKLVPLECRWHRFADGNRAWLVEATR